MNAPLLYPSIDLLDGRVVRLVQGDYNQSTIYDTDAESVAAGYCDGGASWIHIVDLNAAKTGERVNRRIVAAVAESSAGRAPGRVRSRAAPGRGRIRTQVNHPGAGDVVDGDRPSAS